MGAHRPTRHVQYEGKSLREAGSANECAKAAFISLTQGTNPIRRKEKQRSDWADDEYYYRICSCLWLYRR
jgi:uncharacterized protein YhbP (UPF0306 family)